MDIFCAKKKKNCLDKKRLKKDNKLYFALDTLAT